MGYAAARRAEHTDAAVVELGRCVNGGDITPWARTYLS